MTTDSVACSSAATRRGAAATPTSTRPRAADLGDAFAVHRASLVPVVAVFGVIASGALLFLSDFRELAHLWGAKSGSSHGPIVAAVALGLLWARRRQLVCEQRAIAVLPLLGLALTTVVWAGARAASVGILCWALWPVLLWFALRLGFGARTARCVTLPAAYFLLALPLVEVLTAPLQTLTVAAATALLRVAGLDPVILGRTVTIPEGSFEIAEGCSGTHFLTVALATGILFAILLRLRLRQAMLVIAGGVLVALIANWLRVASIIEIGHLTAMRSSLIREHYAFGWLVFTLLMLPFLVLVRALTAATPVASRQAAATPPSLTMAARAFCIGAAALAIAPLWAAGIERAARFQAVPSLALPTVAGWEGPLPSAVDWHPAFPGAAGERLARYRAGAARVDVYAAFYSVQAHGAKLIGYDSSVAGSGSWAERGERVLMVPGEVVESMLVDAAGRERLVWQWFEVRSARLTSGAAVKLHQSLGAFGFPARSGVVALSAECEPGCAGAQAALGQLYRQGLGTWTADSPRS
jgi:EpsI family protein